MQSHPFKDVEAAEGRAGGGGSGGEGGGRGGGEGGRGGDDRLSVEARIAIRQGRESNFLHGLSDDILL